MNRPNILAAAFALVTLAACGGSSDKKTPPPPPPPVSLTTFQDASLAIGHADLVTGAAVTPACDASTLARPIGPTAFDGTNLLVPDTDHQRVLAFSGVPTVSGEAADFVVGQSGATDCTTSADADVAFPQSVSATASPSRLVVADTGSNRVLLYVPSPNASAVTATLVVGQPDLATFDAGCTGAKLNSPSGAIIVGARLLVADAGNHRVLVWDSIPTTDGAAADRVLGQADFTSCAVNRAGSADADTLSYPTDVWSDGARVAVSDSGNNRVLLWSSFPASGADATGVVGQSSFAAAAASTGSDGLSDPRSIASDGTQLAVADRGNSRVLLFPTVPDTGTAAAASAVLGQGSFTRSTPNDDDQDGTEDSGPTARTLSSPSGVAFLDGALFVTDYGNDRVVIFRSSP